MMDCRVQLVVFKALCLRKDEIKKGINRKIRSRRTGSLLLCCYIDGDTHLSNITR